MKTISTILIVSCFVGYSLAAGKLSEVEKKACDSLPKLTDAQLQAIRDCDEGEKAIKTNKIYQKCVGSVTGQKFKSLRDEAKYECSLSDEQKGNAKKDFLDCIDKETKANPKSAESKQIEKQIKKTIAKSKEQHQKTAETKATCIEKILNHK